jgi:hypothetical protein
MDNWKIKYLKYKNKYIQLQNNLNLLKKKGGSDNKISELYIGRLKELYPECKHDTKVNNIYNIDTTYGEMEYEGISILNKKFNPNFDTLNFIDIGSGRGKLVLWYASIPNISNSIGIEIVDERHADAVKLKSELEKNPDFSQYTKKTNLIKSNIFDVNFKKIIQPGSKTIVWFSNLCFNPDNNGKIFEKFINELPSKTIIICSQICSNPKLKNLGNMTIPMSWNYHSTVYFYQI